MRKTEDVPNRVSGSQYTGAIIHTEVFLKLPESHKTQQILSTTKKLYFKEKKNCIGNTLEIRQIIGNMRQLLCCKKKKKNYLSNQVEDALYGEDKEATFMHVTQVGRGTNPEPQSPAISQLRVQFKHSLQVQEVQG